MKVISKDRDWLKNNGFVVTSPFGTAWKKDFDGFRLEVIFCGKWFEASIFPLGDGMLWDGWQNAQARHAVDAVKDAMNRLAEMEKAILARKEALNIAFPKLKEQP